MARSFNGTSDKIAISSSYAGPGANNFTVTAWVYPTNIGASFQSILAGSLNTSLDFQLTTGSKVAITRNGITEIVHGTTSLVNNAWYHVGATFNNGTGAGQIYVNGVLDNSNTQAVAFSGSPTYEIGHNANAAGQFYQGNLADVCQWFGIILTAQEFAALAKGIRPNNIRGGNTSTLWFPLNGLQSPEPEISGNAFNGTLTGTSPAFGPPIAPFTRRMPQLTAPPPLLIITLMPQCVT